MKPLILMGNIDCFALIESLCFIGFVGVLFLKLYRMIGKFVFFNKIVA